MASRSDIEKQYSAAMHELESRGITNPGQYVDPQGNINWRAVNLLGVTDSTQRDFFSGAPAQSARMWEEWARIQPLIAALQGGYEANLPSIIRRAQSTWQERGMGYSGRAREAGELASLGAKGKLQSDIQGAYQSGWGNLNDFLAQQAREEERG